MLNKFFDKFVFVNQLKFKDYNFSLINVPFVILPTDIIAGLCEAENEEFNKRLYYAVKNSVTKELSPRFKLDFGMEPERFLKFSETFFTASGFGFLKNIQLDFQTNRAIVSVSNSAVAQLLQGKVKKPCDHLLRGILAGTFSVAFKTNIECVETKCHAQHQSNCEFVCEPAASIDFSKQEVREQLDLKL
ncbi:MAG: 4-vinyl reductase [Candidatus Diapherotrites archaeon]|nr:4-vinyl reductase [Candidatus Diapherotrites archaeon]